MLDIKEVELSENAKAVLNNPDVKILSDKFNELRQSYESEVDREIEEAKRKMDDLKNVIETMHNVNVQKELLVNKKLVKKYLSDKIVGSVFNCVEPLFKIYKKLFANAMCSDIDLLKRARKVLNDTKYASLEEEKLVIRELSFINGDFSSVDCKCFRKICNQLDKHYMKVYREIKTILKPTKETAPETDTHKNVIEDINHEMFNLFSETMAALPEKSTKDEAQVIFNNFIKEVDDYIESKNPTESERKAVNESFEKFKSVIVDILGKC